MRPTLLVALTLSACAPPPFDPSATDDGQPGIALTWPLPEAEVAGCTYVVADIRNFTLATPGSAVAEGQGHFHLEYPKTDGTIGYGLCDKPYCLVDLATAQVGTINFEARLVANDHVPVTDVNGEQITYRMPVTHVAGACEEGGLDSGGWDSDY